MNDEVSVPTRTGGTGAGLSVALLIVLVLVPVLLYLPILRGDFAYDSRPQVLTSDYIHEPASIEKVLTLRVLREDVMNRRRPVLLVSLMLDSMVWGKNPLGYHLTNVLLHTGCVVLLFLFLLALGRACRPKAELGRKVLWGALAGALLFAVHPVNSEAVCNISYRADMLAAFYLLAALCFASLPGLRSQTNKFAVGAGCSIALLLSAGSKESGIIGPVLLLLYALMIRPREERKVWPWVFLASAALVGGFTVAAFSLGPMKSIIFTDTAPGGSMEALLRVQPRLWTMQILHVLFPQGLCADYGPYSVRGINFPMAVFSLSLVILLVWQFGREDRLVFFSALFCVVALAPTSNVIPLYRPVADRFLYVPMIAVAMIPAAFARRSMSEFGNRAWLALALVVSLGMCALTISRQYVWRDRVTLWENTAAKNPYSTTAHNNLGFAYFDKGKARMAVKSWLEVLQITKGNHADAWAGLAVGSDALGQPLKADAAYVRAAAIDPIYRDPETLVSALRWEWEQARKLGVVAKRVRARVRTRPGVTPPGPRQPGPVAE